MGTKLEEFLFHHVTYQDEDNVTICFGQTYNNSVLDLGLSLQWISITYSYCLPDSSSGSSDERGLAFEIEDVQHHGSLCC